MTIVESRVKSGTFTLGTTPGTSFACQPTNIRVTPNYEDDGDAVEVLCGDTIPAGKKESWVLAGTAIQDFDDDAGFLTYCFTNSMLTVPFTWEPNVTGAPAWAGDLVVVALEEGGDVNTRITTDFEFDIVGKPTRIYGAATVASSPQDEAEAA